MSIKDDPGRQDLERYPLRIQLRCLFADMDSFRHINNGAIGRYFEEGRASLNMQLFGRRSMVDPPAGEMLLFASATIDYIAQAHYPGMVEVGTGIGRIGNSSYVIVQACFQDGRCVALTDTVMVKAKDGKGVPLTSDQREGFEAFMISG